MTQRELAAVLEVSANTVARWERGELRIGDPERVIRLLDRCKQRRRARSAHPTAYAEQEPVDRSQGVLLRRLPAELTSFIGREAELRQLEQLLKSARLLTLTGAGGVGKTRLALRLASQVAEEYPDGVYFVELASLTQADLLPQVTASGLNVAEQRG